MAKMEDWNMVDHNGHRQGVSGKPVPLVVITKVTCDGSLFATSAGVFAYTFWRGTSHFGHCSGGYLFGWRLHGFVDYRTW